MTGARAYAAKIKYNVMIGKTPRHLTVVMNCQKATSVARQKHSVGKIHCKLDYKLSLCKCNHFSLVLVHFVPTILASLTRSKAV